MSKRVADFISHKLADQQRSGLYRRLTSHSGEKLTDFSSNDYLGLARSEELAARIAGHKPRFPRLNGSTGSRLLTGHDAYADEVESILADIFCADAALIFNSGYTANLAVLSALPQRGDTILYDELVHASIKDGTRLSLAKRYSFRHNDLYDLERKLRNSEGRVFIVVESIYSMDGDVCPLHELTVLAEKHDACIILDEAHSTGVMGEQGAGLAVAAGLSEKIPVRIYTFGKAMGVHGACIAGPAQLKDFLINFARPFIYTTAPDHHTLVSIACAFGYLHEHPVLQEKLQENIDVFVNEMRGDPSAKITSSAIQTVFIPGPENVRRCAFDLRQSGFDVRPILSPTVPAGKERLRICLHTFNTQNEIERLCTLLKNKNA